MTRSTRWTTWQIVPPEVGKNREAENPTLEASLDELITWRDLGYNMWRECDDYDWFESLSKWARSTLEEHTADSRPHVYLLEAFESVATHDEPSNPVQTQLIREGRIHNHLRMLWGNNLPLWHESPQTALHIMIEINNRYALDKSNPNSYSGISCVPGLYHRPCGPGQKIFGNVRHLTIENTTKKVRISRHVANYRPD